MKRIISWIVMIPFALVVIVFSAVNRELVTINLWPLPHELTVPMFTLILAVFIFGFLMGGVIAWLSAGKTRVNARQLRHRAEKAERELRSLSNTLDNRGRDAGQNTSVATVPAASNRA